MICLSPVTIRNPNFEEQMKAHLFLGKDEPYLFIQVPCGKCVNCLSNRRNSWCMRLRAEKKNSFNAYFITLTYDDLHLPFKNLPNPEHVSKFLNSFRMRYFRALAIKDCVSLSEVRKSYPPIRYFYVSEFGEKYGRVHYHLLLFNFCLPRQVLIAFLKQYWFYCEPWQFDLSSTVGTVTNSSINYVCKYCLSACDDSLPDGVRCIMRCSRRPGIGDSYLTDAMLDWIKRNPSGTVFVLGDKFRLPRYYESRLPPESLAAIKSSRSSYLQDIQEKDLRKFDNDWISYFRYTMGNRAFQLDKGRKLIKDIKYVYIQPDISDSSQEGSVSFSSCK